MQREKNVKVKDVITTLCKLLSALDVESVPTAEVFRKAKFNKIDAERELWELLYNVMMKAFQKDCACQEPKDTDMDFQFGVVRSILWHSGYGAWWVARNQAFGSKDDIGSREMLLALGWMMSSGNLLEALLREKLLHLEVLSSSAMCAPYMADLVLGLSGCEVNGAAWSGDLRSTQWQHGNLRLRWRNLLAAKQEQASLIHKVYSSICSSPIAADVPNNTGPTGLDKDLERIQFLNRLLRAYLDWRRVEPLFWCWMDSVIDGIECKEQPDDTLLKTQFVTLSCSHDDEVSRLVRHLHTMLQKLEMTLKLRQTESTLAPASQDSYIVNKQQHLEKKEKVERTVVARLQALSRTNTPVAASRTFIPQFQEPQLFRLTTKPPKNVPDQPSIPGNLHASSMLKELRETKSTLEWEVELLRRSQREEIRAQASKLEGLFLTPPVKR